MKTCSFFGHRDTLQTEELKDNVSETVERLIVKEGFDTFLFGSRSQFDELCHIVVTELKEKCVDIVKNIGDKLWDCVADYFGDCSHSFCFC